FRVNAGVTAQVDRAKLQSTANALAHSDLRADVGSLPDGWILTGQPSAFAMETGTRGTILKNRGISAISLAQTTTVEPGKRYNLEFRALFAQELPAPPALRFYFQDSAADTVIIPVTAGTEEMRA